MTGNNGYEKFVVCRIDEKKLAVLNVAKRTQYCVTYNGCRWLCNCPQYLRNADNVNFACKHVVAVFKAIANMKLNDAVEVEIEVSRRIGLAIEDNGLLRCSRCRSKDLELLTFEENGNKALETYRCNECGAILKNYLS